MIPPESRSCSNARLL